MAKNYGDLFLGLPRDLRLMIIKLVGEEGQVTLRRCSRDWRNYFNNDDWQQPLAERPRFAQIAILCRLALHIAELESYYLEPKLVERQLATFCDLTGAYPRFTDPTVTSLALTCLARLRGLTDQQRADLALTLSLMGEPLHQALMNTLLPIWRPSASHDANFQIYSQLPNFTHWINDGSLVSYCHNMALAHLGHAVATLCARRGGFSPQHNGLLAFVEKCQLFSRNNSNLGWKLALLVDMIEDRHSRHAELAAWVHEVEESARFHPLLLEICQWVSGDVALQLLTLRLARQSVPTKYPILPQEILTLVSRLHAHQAQQALALLLTAIVHPAEDIYQAALAALPSVVKQCPHELRYSDLSPVINTLPRNEGKNALAVSDTLATLLQHTGALVRDQAISDLLVICDNHSPVAVLALQKITHFLNPIQLTEITDRLFSLLASLTQDSNLQKERVWAMLIPLIKAQKQGASALAQRALHMIPSLKRDFLVVFNLISLIEPDPRGFILPLLKRVLEGDALATDARSDSIFSPDGTLDREAIISSLCPLLNFNFVDTCLHAIITDSNRQALIKTLWKRVKIATDATSNQVQQTWALPIALTLIPHLSIKQVLFALDRMSKLASNNDTRLLVVAAISSASRQGIIQLEETSKRLLYCIYAWAGTDSTGQQSAVEALGNLDFSHKKQAIPLRDLMGLASDDNLRLRFNSMVILLRLMPLLNKPQLDSIALNFLALTASFDDTQKSLLIAPLTTLFISAPSHPLCQTQVVTLIITAMQSANYLLAGPAFRSVKALVSLLNASQLKLILETIVDARAKKFEYHDDVRHALNTLTHHLTQEQLSEWLPVFSDPVYHKRMLILQETNHASKFLAKGGTAKNFLLYILCLGAEPHLTVAHKLRKTFEFITDMCLEKPYLPLARGKTKTWELLFSLLSFSHRPELDFLFSNTLPGTPADWFTCIAIAAGINLRFILPQFELLNVDHPNAPYLIIAALRSPWHASTYCTSDVKKNALALIKKYCSRVRDSQCLETLELALMEQSHHPQCKVIFEKKPHSFWQNTLFGTPATSTADLIFEEISRCRERLRLGCSQHIMP